ncbi:MAG: ABC transporter substrate-binding protein [Gemmatimonadetes bacterium]|nr:ABC transporter substrate-binding protein [Gemmatimonadota bacterium]
MALTNLPVHRIVSTMQSANEWLLALGAADRLVARTDFDRQPEFAHLPSIGGGLDPSPEAVAALHPDVVIGWQIRASVDLQTALQPFHIPVLSFETTDTADAFRQLARMGALVGRQPQADSIARSLRGELAAIHADACREFSAPETVFLVLWTEPPQTAGGGTWMTTLLETACLKNVFEDEQIPWPTIGMESITARQPRYILTSRGDTIGKRLAEFRAKPGWRDLEAIKAGRVIEIPGDLFARAGPTLPAAARAIVAERRRLAGR